ncbi:MAG: glycosyltransferase family 9 protein [Blastocatellia bacterium]
MNSEPHSTDAEPEQLVSEILTHFQAGGAYPRNHVERLTKLAISEDRQVAERASECFFGSLVETLADSFEPAAVSLCNQACAQLIQVCRNTERGRPLDEKLREFGLRTEADVLARAEDLRTSWEHSHPWLSGVDHTEQSGPERFQPGRVMVLSRVTLGADVAITSVIIERLKTTFPSAEIVLVGGRKASELFGGDRRLAFKEINYPRAATALDRLLAWLPLVDCVRELTEGVERSLIIDPDSRLSQLGLLPLSSGVAGKARADGADYLFFPSREYRHDSMASLSELTSAWLDEVLGPKLPAYPVVSLTPADVDTARSLAGRIRRERHPVIAINFGVGGNPSKRVGDGFERQLVSSLLRDGATVFLDKGAGAGEAKRAEAVFEFAKRSSNDRLRMIELDEESLPRLLGEDRIEAELAVWSGRIGLLAALIGESDLYIGYDSAGQHIAAALGVPCIDVFAGFSSRRMLDRWRPTGKAETRVVVVEQSMTEDEVLSETLGRARELLDQCTG